MLYCPHSVIPSDSTYLFVDVKQAARFLNYQHIEVYTPRKYSLSTHRLEDMYIFLVVSLFIQLAESFRHWLSHDVILF